MNKNSKKAWLYLLPAIAFLAVFMVYPLIDVFIYSFEENFNFVTGSDSVGLYNYERVLSDPNFTSALKNTAILVFVTVPLSTVLALLIAVALSSVKAIKKAFQTIYFLPYVTNTIAVGMVFVGLFASNDGQGFVGLANRVIGFFGGSEIDFITGPYWAKMLVLSVYTIWMVLPFKILILTSALASVKQDYYNAAKIDGTSKWRTFRKITVPMISPTLFYLIITGFIGAFKAYNDAVALFGEDLNSSGMNTIVGYIYNMLFSDGGGYPSYASAAAVILFFIVLTVTCINLTVSRKHVHYS